VATERPWYKDAQAGGGDIVFTPPYMSYANHYILTTLSQMQPDGETVFAYDIKMGDIQELAASMSKYEGEQILIADGTGTIIGSTDPQYLGGCLDASVEDAANVAAQAAVQAEDTKGKDQEQISKDQDQLRYAEAFYQFRSELGGQLEKVTGAETDARKIHLGNKSYYGIRRNQGNYRILVLVPSASIWLATVGNWLVPLLVVELLLIYVIGRVNKGMKNRELKKAYIELGQTQKRLELALNAAQKAAAIDDLTGLMNLKSFYTNVQSALDEMDEGERAILLMIDGDHFKQVNDNYGHSAGDEVIKLAAQMIIGRIRVVDLASRLHGDEYAIFVTNTSDYEVARRIMADINKTIANESPKRNLPPITLSAGAVVAKHGDSYTALAKAADEALYRAKETHNGRVAYDTEVK
jgi:diguanylate cyclase (GGDEF)-like protein